MNICIRELQEQHCSTCLDTLLLEQGHQRRHSGNIYGYLPTEVSRWMGKMGNWWIFFQIRLGFGSQFRSCSFLMSGPYFSYFFRFSVSQKISVFKFVWTRTIIQIRRKDPELYLTLVMLVVCRVQSSMGGKRTRLSVHILLLGHKKVIISNGSDIENSRNIFRQRVETNWVLSRKHFFN